MTVIWHNGSFKEEIPVFMAHDRIRLGEAIFDVMPAVDGRLCYANLHLPKLLRAGDVFFGSWTPPALEKLEDAARELLRHNNFTQGKYTIRTLITRGPAGDGIRLPETESLQIVMRTTPLPAEFPPINAIIATTTRRNEGSPLSRIKCANYGESVLALREAAEKGANEAIMLNNAGKIACATTSNIFIVLNGTLLTPPLDDGAQEGVTRRLVIEKYGALEKSLTPDDLLKAEGLYLTNSGRGVSAVHTLNGIKLPMPSIKIDKELHLS
jgi:branched-chain amino acid aminotransferase